MKIPDVNLLFAWTWILTGFLSGMIMGLRFHDENWLGGYGAYKRRMYRLGHISFFGLGAVNFIFYFTARSLDSFETLGQIASYCFLVGGLTMPLCCALMARSQRARLSFGVPVLSLISGAVLTILEILI